MFLSIMSSRGRSVPPWLDAMARWGWRLLVIAAVGVVVAWLLGKLKLLWVPGVAALFLTTLLEPPVRWLRTHGFPALIASWLVFLAFLGVFAGLGYLLLPDVAAQLIDVGASLEQGLERAEAWVSRTFGLSQQEIDRLVDRGFRYARENASRLLAGVFGGAFIVGEAIAGVLLTLVFLFFFMKDGGRFVRWGLGHVPEDRREVFAAAARRTWSILGGYLRAVAITGIVDASVIGLGLVLIGVPLVLPLMVLTFLGAFFPLVGAFLAGLVAVVVALVTQGLTDALLVTGVVILVQQLEGDLVAPLVYGRAMRLHPLVVLVALTAGGLLAGILGAALAVPLAAVIVGITDEVRVGQGRVDERRAPAIEPTGGS